MPKKVNGLLSFIPKSIRARVVYLVVLTWLLITHMLKVTLGLLKDILVYIRPRLRLVIVIFIFSVLVLFSLFFSSSKDTSVSDVITYSVDNPIETRPDDSYKWSGGLNDPKKIMLPTIQSEGYIQKVGIDQNNEIAVPNNIHIAGWFVDTVLPGEKGLSIIDGHVDGRSSSGGVFKELARLNKDDEFTIEFGGGDLKSFRIVSVDSVGSDDAGRLLFSQNTSISNQLNLISCTGQYDRRSRQY